MERSDRLRAASSDCGASCAAALFRLRGKTCGVFAFGRYMAAALFRLRRATNAARLFRLAGKTGAVPLFRLRHKTGCIPARRHSNGFGELADPDGLPDLGPVLY